MKRFFTGLALMMLVACGNTVTHNPSVETKPDFLRDINSFTSDSLVNVVIEIPAGTSEKWEVNKETGQIEWEQESPGFFRVIDYLPYPANYGFVPQTILTEASGGDGDPVDVFVLGPSLARETVVKVRIVGIITMLDNMESDPKLLAVNSEGPNLDADSFEMLSRLYPGVTEIINLWLLHYKGPGIVRDVLIQDEKDALLLLKEAHMNYFEGRKN